MSADPRNLHNPRGRRSRRDLEDSRDSRDILCQVRNPLPARRDAIRNSSRPWIFGCIIVVIAISGIGWLRLHVDSSLEPLLPEHNDARRALIFLRDSSFAAKAVLWFRLTGPSGSLSDLYAAEDQVEKQLDPALIKRVIRPPREGDAIEGALGLLDHAGELLHEDDLAELKTMTTPPALAKRMREVYVQLVKPEGSFLQQIIRRDPLGISTRVLGRLYELTNSMGYRVNVTDGRFVHPDGRQLMLILETSTSASNLAGSEALVKHLNALSASAPPGIQIIPICGQIHTAQNQTLMEGDMKRAGAINAIAFFLLFLAVGRDWRVTAVFLLPVATILITIGLCALAYPHLSLVVIGIAATMAGSAVDYGIFVYTAIWLGNDPQADVRRILRPLIISHLTTLGVFVAFLFSTIPAYRQLGVLTCISLVLSLLGAIFVLPTMIRPGGKVMVVWKGMPLRRWGRLMVPAVVIGAVLFIVAIYVARGVGFDSDMTRMDGITPAVRQAEKDFQHNWGRSDTEMAMLVVSGKTRDEAEQANDEINSLMTGKLTQGPLTSLSSFWPSAAKRQANEARWRAFWTEQRIADLRHDLAVAGEPYGFSARAFAPFFASLPQTAGATTGATPGGGTPGSGSLPASVGGNGNTTTLGTSDAQGTGRQAASGTPSDDAPRQMLASIEEQFVARSSDGGWQMLNYFEDTDANVTAARTLLRDQPEAQVVSRRALGQAFAESAVSETHLLVSISVAFIVGSLLVLTRSLTKSVIIMLPVVTGIAAMLAVMALMSMSMSAITVVAAILVLALASDYGVFATYAWQGNETILGQGMASIHLSSITTVVGTGALLFAHHPAMFIIGVSLTSGLLGGYLTAFLVIPGVCYLLERRRKGVAT